MWGNALCSCLRLAVCLTFILRPEGVVIAPTQLEARAGLPFLLGCNVTMATDDKLRKVQWLDGEDRVIVSYLVGLPGSVVTEVKRVELATGHSHTSAIIIKRAMPQDQGCYRCVFNVYPSGTQEGKTCLSVVAKVGSEGNRTTVSGRQATLSCDYALGERVQQVLWKKTTEQGDTMPVASFHRNSSPDVRSQFRGRVTLGRSVENTKLSIQPVRTEDEGCYTCEFHTYPDGTKTATACLAVYVLPEPQVSYVTVSPGIVEVNCTAVSRPAAEVTWNMEGHNGTLGPAVTSYEQQGDGTTLVVSTMLLQTALLEGQPITCVMNHPGLDKPTSASVSKFGSTHIILIIVGCVGLLLLVVVCVCVKKC